MSDVETWLSARRPTAPPHLLDRLSVVERGNGELLETLQRSALEALGRASRAPGRVRESAFHLLAADALLTYACEAALEAGSSDEILEDLMKATAAPR